MKKIFILTVILFFFFQAAPAMNKPSVPGNHSAVLTIAPQLEVLSTLKIKDAEKLLGRKMKLKEKIAFRLFQWKLKKELKSKKGESGVDHGKTSMILGIVGLGLLLLPYVAIAALPCAILAIILGNKARKADKNDKKALTGIILGWITIGIFVIAIALVVAILSSWGGWGWG